MHPTSYPEFNALLDDLLADIQGVLADSQVGMYLYGSVNTGSFNLHVSDVDVLVVTAIDVDDALFADLQVMHLEFERSRPSWCDRIQGRVPGGSRDSVQRRARSQS